MLRVDDGLFRLVEPCDKRSSFSVFGLNDIARFPRDLVDFARNVRLIDAGEIVVIGGADVGHDGDPGLRKFIIRFGEVSIGLQGGEVVREAIEKIPIRADAVIELPCPGGFRVGTIQSRLGSSPGVSEAVVRRNRRSENGERFPERVLCRFKGVTVLFEVGTVCKRRVKIDRHVGKHLVFRQFDLLERDSIGYRAVRDTERTCQDVLGGSDIVIRPDEFKFSVFERDSEVEDVGKDRSSCLVFVFRLFQHLFAEINRRLSDGFLRDGQLNIVVCVGHGTEQKTACVLPRFLCLVEAVLLRKDVHLASETVENEEGAVEGRADVRGISPGPVSQTGGRDLGKALADGHACVQCRRVGRKALVVSGASGINGELDTEEVRVVVQCNLLRLFDLCYEHGDGVKQNMAEAVKWYRQSADQGFVPAQFGLGVCYENGAGVNQDKVEAVKWYRKAAEQGDARAQLNLGFCYRIGDGVEQNMAEAVKWTRKAAEQGEAMAQLNLGVFYASGMGVEQDKAEAVKWIRKAAEQDYEPAKEALKHLDAPEKVDTQEINADLKQLQQAAEQGDAKAQCKLALCYANGVGVKQDYAEAVKWSRKAAEQGDAMAQLCLGNCYKNGEGVKQDDTEAIKWVRKAAEQGFAPAQFNLGLYYNIGDGVERDDTTAAKWWRKAADQGLAEAQFNLGVCYANGVGVEQDYAEAIKWIRMAAEQGYEPAKEALKDLGAPEKVDTQEFNADLKQLQQAAEQGDADAQCMFGVCYANGDGVKQNMAEAVKWFRKAADQGFAPAQYNLGTSYYYGDGVEQNLPMAAKWYRKAADQGFAESQFILGLCYYEGKGVEQNKAEAVKWFRKAAEQGHELAKEALKDLGD